ncbi:hypothetical protein [Ferrimonas aestuarii]|uniref:Uncharacterized protein n=1 Tax=Ferrimonas aestuarii TaxID=2569539 RepID=A0A4U1BTY1_9GAMM|nr:hypothetical protein [Ferrimonas aestuarii]TKB58659.1 hypothetical protein FCL42_02615 [Ferrimonas aestuarii]
MGVLTEKPSVWQRFKTGVRTFFAALTLPEKLYVTAPLIWILAGGDPLWPSLMTLVALLLEFWPRFTHWWESLAGKAVILLFYGVITNFALASAAGVVNEVTGVSASHFNYTHNFALMMLLPIWFAVSSGIALLMFQVVAPFYLLLILLLKPFGVKLVRHVSKSAYPFTTNALRFCLSVLLLVQCLTLLDSQSSGLATEFVNGEVAQIDVGNGEVSAQVLVDELLLEDYEKNIRIAVAQFAFNQEADTRSRCQLEAHTRAVELNDYEILTISHNDQADFGFDFVVKRCVSPAFPAVEEKAL